MRTLCSPARRPFTPGGPARATPRFKDQYNKITWLGYSVEFPLNLQEIQL